MSLSPVSVKLNAIGRDFGAFTALHDIDLEIEAGSFVSLLGPSGCGKTTTLRLIAGFDTPTRGRILIGESDVTRLPPNRRRLGMVFQNYALFPHMTVAENIGFGPRMAGVTKEEISARVARMLDMIHLGSYGDRMPAQLSGGQQQRVAIARSLITEPSVLLLDEPMAALDKNLRHSMQNELRQIQRDFKITTILVTHDQDEALTLSDKIVVMEGGYVRQVGTPEEVYDRPVSGFVANFLGMSNNLPARIVDVDGDGRAKVELRLAGVEPVRTVAPSRGLSGDVMLSVRPEGVTLEDETVPLGEGKVALPGRIVSHVFRGSYHEYVVAIAGQPQTIAVFEQARASETGSRWATGASVRAVWPASIHNLFAANS